MPLIGLPFILENNLDMLLKESRLSSWQIRGGESFTQVTLRFPINPTPGHTGNLEYRRASRSRLVRDQMRARERHSNLIDTVENENNNYAHSGVISAACEVSIPQDNSDHSAKDTMDISITTVKSELQTHVADDTLHCLTQSAQATNQSTVSIVTNPPEQPPLESQAASDDTVTCISQSDHDDSTESIVSTGSSSEDLRFSVSDEFKDKITEIMKVLDRIESQKFMTTTEKQVSSADSRVDNDDNDDIDGTFTCDGCGGMMLDQFGTVWYRCTDCDDKDFCLECYNKDIHGHHKRHLHKFACPDNWTLPHCNSCGQTFPKDSNNNIYKCDMCEDYCLCLECKQNLMHIKHLKYFKCISVVEFCKEMG